MLNRSAEQFELSIAESLRPIAFLFAELGGILNRALVAAGRSSVPTYGFAGKFEGGFALVPLVQLA